MGGTIRENCALARVSRAGYYRWLKIEDRTPKDCADALLIKEIFDKGKSRYGWRTIQMRLAAKGIVMNHKKILRIKRKYDLITKIRRRNPYKAIMKKTREHRTFGNVLDRKFQECQPREAFCTDITYLPFSRGMAYLSAVKDIASREIVGWSISRHLHMSLVFDTVRSMAENPDVSSLADILIHSDQGFHYTSPEFIARIRKLAMVQSMSRKGNCVDNAPVESFFGHLKDEVDYRRCQSFDELCERVQAYMDYYNRERPQWALKKMTPVEYRKYLRGT